MKTMNFSALLLVISCLTALPACSDYKNSKTSETASKDLHDESMAEWRITRSEESLADKKSAGDTSRQGKEILIKAIKFTEDDLDISQVSYLELCSPKKCIKTQKKRNNIDSVDNIKGRANEIGRVFVDNGLVEIKTIRLHKTNPGSPVISSTIYPSINLEAIPDTFEVILVAAFGSNCKNDCLVKISARSEPVINGIYNLVYNPIVGLDVDLGFGVTLQIPKNAIKNPEIFIVTVDDIGSVYPQVVIYPRVVLDKPGRISIKAIRSAAIGSLEEIHGKKPVHSGHESRDLVINSTGSDESSALTSFPWRA
ncbi:hypothetical protein EHV23_05215 [Lautropia dentalis]|uniref:Lipoprotein n=1 Tax=Lautropia dentalis TaxID=2490857 RepID=A0A3R8MYS8_9BURK|nr:hypothetical protein [Lautropia dentalis]RRN45575.1 hypothetical protein EHV23_05215 [Lautropia dentalis]